MTAAELQDGDARRVIVEDLASTLFVEAGAGSGKTKSLVDRVVAIVVSEGIPLRHVAAVTFTDKAAAELRDRLRATFERFVRDTSDTSAAARATLALDDLDSAAIGTLHSFARRVLSAHPIEAGLPPLIEVLDEVGSQVAFDRRWSELSTGMLVDDSVSAAVVLARELNIRPDHLRSIARTFNAEWDRLQTTVLEGPIPAMPTPRVDDLVTRARVLVSHRAQCTDPEDKFLSHLDSLEAWADEADLATTDIEAVRALSACLWLKSSYGRKASWSSDLDDLKSELKSIQAEAALRLAAVTESLLRRLSHRIAEATLGWAHERQHAGRLEFHDLLVLARDVVRSPERGADVRAALHDRYQRLLLDEFQDTDPIQIELAARIAGGRAASQEHWQDIAVPEGRLFVVGDPKQSIYRFRRADIRTYLEAQDRVGRSVSLTTNFRTTEPLLDWVNHVFARLIVAAEGSQPAYTALDHHRDPHPDGHHVVILGPDAHPSDVKADGLREREAADVAAAVACAWTERWPVYDYNTRDWRPVRLDDIAILVPARTSLHALEEAFDAADIPFRAEASSLVYRTEEVRELLVTARAIDDPSDGLALVAALRSSLFGCGDDDLWLWKQAGGSFNLLAPLPASVPEGHPVRDAVEYLKVLEKVRPWRSPSEVLDALVRDRRMLESGTGGERTRDVWRRLRFVVDQARAWSESEQGGLRAYLAWARRQGDESARVHEAVLPETDLNAVRVLTVHAAKGLEFPVVIVSGMSSRSGGNNSGVEVLWTDTGYAVKLTKDVQTGDFEVAKPLDEQMGHHERLRLLYVACTRARDHLVVSTHRSARKNPATSDVVKTNAELLSEACAGAVQRVLGAVETFERVVAEQDAVPLPAIEEWRAKITSRLEAAAAPSAVSASSFEGSSAAQPAVEFEPDPGLQKGQRNLELPPWNKGRYGTAVGRAVHGVMQTVDLSSGSGLDDAVAAQCLAEGVIEHGDVVRSLCRNALASDPVQRAARHDHWRETYVGTTRDDGTVLEGFIDLVYRDDDGSLVIVDYKTDAIPGAAFAARAEFYRPQMNAYVEALSQATGNRSVSAVLLFLNPEGAAAHPM